jgi:hypothetical protein
MLAMFALTLAGCGDAEVSKFNSAARNLKQMLTTTGNDDNDVLAACSAVEEAYKRVDVSHVPKQQADAMKSVADGAQFWRLQLTQMKLHAVRDALGGDDGSAATDMEIGRLMFSGIQRSVSDYVDKYD